jgi:hypothetical protein
MYKLNYYRRSIVDNANKGLTFEYVDMGESFRLRRNALHYLFDIVQSEYKERGYATEIRVGSLYCYKSEKTAEGNRKITEMLIKVEK